MLAAVHPPRSYVFHRLLCRLAVFVFATVLQTAAHAAEFDAAIGQQGFGRCHMDWCGFFIIDAAVPIGSKKTGTLFAVSSRDWGASYKRTDDDHEYDRAPISVEPKKTRLSMVFCSKTDPVLFDYEEGKWQAGDLRPGDEASVFGFNESGYQFYYAACHHFITHDPVSKAMAERLGYTFAAHPNAGNLPDDKRQPMDLLK